jgi:hypothetical protein
MLDLISNVHVDELMEPRGIPEAAATTQLKHRRSLLSMKPALREFHYFQRDVFIAVMEAIVRWMPDQQISELMGNSERFIVRDKTILDKTTKTRAALMSMRMVRTNVRLEPNENNNTQRLLELQGLQMLTQLGVPVDPQVMFDMMSMDQAKKDRLKMYARTMLQQRMKIEKMNLDSAKRQIEGTMAINAMRERIRAADVAEKERWHKEAEATKALDVGLEFQTRFLDLWIRADAADRDRIATMFTELMKLEVQLKQQQQAGSSENG